MITKRFVSPASLLQDSFRLARKIHDSGFNPDIIVVLWRGGAPVGIAVHEFLSFKGINTYHTVVKVESYRGIGNRSKPKIEDIHRVLRRTRKNSRVLVVDDIFDTGETLMEICRAFKKKTSVVKTAVLYFKKGIGKERPDYHIRETSAWIVFPHELVGLTPDEIRKKGRIISQLLHKP